jgi:hypothetical protein
MKYLGLFLPRAIKAIVFIFVILSVWIYFDSLFIQNDYVAANVFPYLFLGMFIASGGVILVVERPHVLLRKLSSSIRDFWINIYVLIFAIGLISLMAEFLICKIFKLQFFSLSVYAGLWTFIISFLYFGYTLTIDRKALEFTSSLNSGY